VGFGLLVAKIAIKGFLHPMLVLLEYQYPVLKNYFILPFQKLLYLLYHTIL